MGLAQGPPLAPRPPAAPELPPAPPRPRDRARARPGELPRRGLDWKWVLLGVLFMVAGNSLAYWLLRPLLEQMLRDEEQVAHAAALMALTALSVYFVGGLLVGRMSQGQTVNEPAVAGVFSLLIVFVLQLQLGMVNVIGVVIGAPTCFGVAYLGGALGERWQRWSAGGPGAARR